MAHNFRGGGGGVRETNLLDRVLFCLSWKCFFYRTAFSTSRTKNRCSFSGIYFFAFIDQIIYPIKSLPVRLYSTHPSNIRCFLVGLGNQIRTTRSTSQNLCCPQTGFDKVQPHSLLNKFNQAAVGPQRTPI